MTDQDIQVVKLPLDEPVRHRVRRTVVVIGLTMLVSAPGFWLIAKDRNSAAKSAAAFWRVEGRPCAPLDAAAFKGVQRAPSVTPYDGTIYERHAGGMTCTHRTKEIGGVAVRYPICKFDQPDYLAVSVGGQERFYDLTMGHSAAVQVVGGEVRCVVTPRFEM
jgi:hypothetical protein